MPSNTVVRFNKKTRYKPRLDADGHVLISAHQRREFDMERLVENLPQHLLDRLADATADELVVMAAFAEGLHNVRLRSRDLVVNGQVIVERDGDFDRLAAAVPRVFPPRRNGRRRP